MEIKGKVYCFFEQGETTKMEEWKDIKGYEGLYQVSNLGRVRSVDHYANISNGNKRFVKGRILKQWKNCNGYMCIKIWNKDKRKSFVVHRLVAIAFIENPHRLPDINHKDEVKQNNVVANLEWCNHSYNALYGSCQDRLRKYKQKQVDMINIETGKVIKTFESMKKAGAELNIHKEQISSVCRGLRKTAGGYFWRYAK